MRSFGCRVMKVVPTIGMIESSTFSNCPGMRLLFNCVGFVEKAFSLIREMLAPVSTRAESFLSACSTLGRVLTPKIIYFSFKSSSHIRRQNQFKGSSWSNLLMWVS